MHPESLHTQESVVYDTTEPCPYLPAETARMPLRYRPLPLSAEEFNQRMIRGERRSGPFMYRPTCPSCRACESIRLPVAEFQPTRTQRRVWKRGMQEIHVELRKPVCDQQRLDLFNLHRTGRGLHYCLHCDAYMFVDEPVYVMGHGESAAHVAMIMLNFTPEVDLLLRGAEPTWRRGPRTRPIRRQSGRRAGPQRSGDA